MKGVRTRSSRHFVVLIVTCKCKELATSDDFYVLQINFDGWGRALTKNKAKVLSQNPPKSAIYGNFFKYGVAEKCHATIHTHTHFLHFFLNFTALCCEPA